MRFFQYLFLVTCMFSTPALAETGWPTKLFTAECPQQIYTKQERNYSPEECALFQSALSKEFYTTHPSKPTLSPEEIALLKNVDTPHSDSSIWVFTESRLNYFDRDAENGGKRYDANFKQLFPIAVDAKQWREKQRIYTGRSRTAFGSTKTFGLMNDQGYFEWRNDPNYELDAKGNITSGFPKPLAPSSPRTCKREHPIHKEKNFNCDWESHIKNIADKEQQRFYCMACNVYFEARAEGTLGMELVAEVTLNRVNNYHIANATKKYRFIDAANSKGPQGGICEVVYANKQFSWTHDGETDRVQEKASWHEALAVADVFTKMQFNENSDKCETENTPGNCHKDWEAKTHVTNPNLVCYNYYLSLDYYKSTSDFQPWMHRVFASTKSTDGDHLQPLCIGRHIFMRDNRQAIGDTCTDRVSTNPEFEDQRFAARNRFYSNCLNYKTPPEMSFPKVERQSSLCSEATLDEVRTGQWAEYGHEKPPGAFTPSGANDDGGTKAIKK